MVHNISQTNGGATGIISQPAARTATGVLGEQAGSLVERIALSHLSPEARSLAERSLKVKSYLTDPINTLVRDLAKQMGISGLAFLFIESMLTCDQIALDPHEKMGVTLDQYKKLQRINGLLNEYKCLNSEYINLYNSPQLTLSQKCDRNEAIELRKKEIEACIKDMQAR